MKQKRLVIIAFALLIVIYVYKKDRNVAKVLPPEIEQEDSYKPNPEIKSESVNQEIYDEPTSEKIGSKIKSEIENLEVYKKGESSKEIVRSFSEKTYLDVNGFEEFDFADFSEDDLAMMVGRNPVGDKLTIMATRLVPDKKDVINLLSKDSSLFESTDPDFNPSLMQPVLSTGSQNGFSDVQIWKSSQNGKIYYMFFAPRADGKGSYGVLLDGKKQNLEANEDYYEEQLLKIRARNE